MPRAEIKRRGQRAIRAILIQGRPNTAMGDDERKAILKPLAVELGPLCGGRVDWGHLRRMATMLHDGPANCTMQAARLIQTGRGNVVYDSRSLVLVDPME